MTKEYYVYILSSKYDDVFYIGVTSNLQRRIYEHKNHRLKGFTDTYNVTKLIYFETTCDVNEAIAREKQLKGWSRKKKEELIRKSNPQFLEINIL